MSARDPIKVYDARWEADEFSDGQVRRLFEATCIYGRQLGVDTITLTRDTRLAAGRVLELAMAEALRQGFRVYARAEPVSTPQSYFTALLISQEHPRTMGLAITASHNPKQYVGVKFTVPIVQAIGEDCGPMGGLTRIRQIYHSPENGSVSGRGTLELLDLTSEYIDFSLANTRTRPGDLAGLRVVLDSFHGSAGPEIFMALARAGVHVEPMRLVPDGNFPTGSPNPTSQNKMDQAVALAGEKNCHAVFGIDGDGDRIVFGDRRGILTAGFAFVPILRACLAAEGVEGPCLQFQKTLTLPSPGGPGEGCDASSGKQSPGVLGEGSEKDVPVLYDPKVSPLALVEWGRLGTRPVLFRNGHSQIKDHMTRIGALAAAEESGHYYHRIRMGNLTVSGENSIMTILLFLGALKRDPGLMDQLWEMQNRIFTTGEFNYQFESDATRDQAMAAVIQRFVDEGAQTVSATPDGIDLQGTCISRGVHLGGGSIGVDEGWYSGYLRIATNEKSVVRSYFSTGETASGKRVEREARRILGQQFHGKQID